MNFQLNIGTILSMKPWLLWLVCIIHIFTITCMDKILIYKPYVLQGKIIESISLTATLHVVSYLIARNEKS